MSEAFGPVVNPVDDGVGPPCQWRIIGVEGALVKDVPQRSAQQRCWGPS